MKVYRNVEVFWWKRYAIHILKQKNVSLFILRADKINSKAKKIPWVKKGHFIMIKVSIYQGFLVNLNFYVLKNGTQK